MKRKIPNEFQIKLLGSLVANGSFIEVRILSGFEKEIQELQKMGYIEKYYGYLKLTHFTLDCEDEIGWYICNHEYLTRR